MEILGIGFQELVFLLLIAIIVLGPKDMQRAGRTIGRWLNRFVHSDSWKALQRASQEIRRLPTTLMREANLDKEDLREMDDQIRRSIDPRQYPIGPAATSPRRTTPPPDANPPSEPPAVPPADVRPDQEQHE